MHKLQAEPGIGVGPLAFGTALDDVRRELERMGLEVERDRLDRWWDEPGRGNERLRAKMSVLGSWELTAVDPTSVHRTSFVLLRFDREDKLVFIDISGTGKRPTSTDPTLRPLLYGLDVFGTTVEKVVENVAVEADAPPEHWDREPENPRFLDLGVGLFRESAKARYFSTFTMEIPGLGSLDLPT